MSLHDAIAAHRDEMVGFVRRRAGHLLDPEDVVQAAAARALAAADALRDPSRARPWLFRIVRNELADQLRRIGLPVAELPEDLPDPDPARPTAGPCKCALEIAGALKPEYQQILERAVLDEVSLVDVARELGITANNATVRLHRARNALRAAVHRKCGTTAASDCSECTC